MAIGARGGIQSVECIEKLMANGERHASGMSSAG
jgi:hypothetical protein